MTTKPAWLHRLGLSARRFWRKLTLADLPVRLARQFRLFFGDDLEQLETHDKQFPGYDIASLNRALASFHEDCCLEHREVGSTGALSMRGMLDSFKTSIGYWSRPTRPTHARVPIDVEEEASVVINGIYFCVMRPEAGANRKRRSASLRPEEQVDARSLGPEKLAVLLAVNVGVDYWDGTDASHMPMQRVTVSVACRNRDVADRFFAELEERRQRLSIYRGKVIDPVVQGSAVVSIGFRAIKQVREQDLILPETVKDLIERAVVGFYNHGELLQKLGIELKRGVLLHGPPGTGKTSISLYLAGLLPNFTVCFVSGDRLFHPREICKMARYLQPALVVFEDIDLIAQERDANGLATVLGELMNQIDGCEPTDQVLFVMNTNSLERLESAVRNRPGRVDQLIEVPLPDRAARLRLLGTFARTVRLEEGNLERALDATRDMSPAMLKEIVKRAVVMAIVRQAGRSKEVTVVEDDLVLAATQAQTMRDPIRAPGDLGFRPSRLEAPVSQDGGLGH